jgi:hypothetical protein
MSRARVRCAEWISVRRSLPIRSAPALSDALARDPHYLVAKQPSFDDVNDRHVTEGELVRAGGRRAQHQSQSECGCEISHPRNFHGFCVGLTSAIGEPAEPLRKNDKLSDHTPLRAVVERQTPHYCAICVACDQTICHWPFRFS